MFRGARVAPTCSFKPGALAPVHFTRFIILYAPPAEPVSPRKRNKVEGWHAAGACGVPTSKPQAKTLPPSKPQSCEPHPAFRNVAAPHTQTMRPVTLLHRMPGKRALQSIRSAKRAAPKRAPQAPQRKESHARPYSASNPSKRFHRRRASAFHRHWLLHSFRSGPRRYRANR